MELLHYWPYMALGLILICVAAFAAFKVYQLMQKPTEEQLQEVKEWLLWAVMIAEDALGSGTGQMKLRYVYDMFVERFPWIAKVLPFDTFSQMVDEALDKFESALQNKNIANLLKHE